MLPPGIKKKDICDIYAKCHDGFLYQEFQV